jgi:hypothetical protein
MTIERIRELTNVGPISGDLIDIAGVPAVFLGAFVIERKKNESWQHLHSFIRVFAAGMIDDAFDIASPIKITSQISGGSEHVG